MNFAKFLRTLFTEHLWWLLLYFVPLIISGIADEVKILWIVNIQCDHSIQGTRPYMTVVNKDERNCIIIDIVVPGDIRVRDTKREKLEKYQDLKREIKKILNVRSVIVLPVIVGGLGSIAKKLDECLGRLDITLNTALLQKTKLLGTVRILRKVLAYQGWITPRGPCYGFLVAPLRQKFSNESC